MMMEKVLLATFVLQIVISPSIQQLAPDGPNVCKRTVRFNVYENKQFSRIGYTRYYSSCGFIGWSRCARSRQTTVYYYNSVLVVRYRDVYSCCPGWAASGNACPTPICSPPCNNGACVRPNVCSCNSGWAGKTCDQDIDECAKKPCHQICNNLPGSYSCSCKRGFIHPSSNPKDPKCQDVDECTKNPCSCALGDSCKASCVNTIGSFQCKCSQGFQVQNGRICADIDECKSTSTNHCEQICLNGIGNYTCSCRIGYQLASNKRNCEDIDECSTLNGGCNQICQNAIGTYQCLCKPGYRLSSDKKTCIDIDECSEGTPCDRKNGQCFNTVGSYYCTCNSGYLLSKDNHSCSDINECSHNSTNLCTQVCHNTNGSYYCSCWTGFRLGKDNATCDDIDECAEQKDSCEHNCHNTVGSYKCSCRRGYKLEKDELSCQGLPCQSIAEPEYGSMTCSGFVTDQSCLFECQRGFYLVGSGNRTCLATSSWSGTSASCARKSCPDIIPPDNGGVSLPCLHLFNQTCALTCSNSYYMVGINKAVCSVKDTGETYWSKGNISCEVVEACQPNPCQHGGHCQVTTKNTYVCICDHTGYHGKDCSIGHIRIPQFSELTVGVWSTSYRISAFSDKPLLVKVKVVHGDVVIDTDSLLFSRTKTTAEIRLKALKPGKIIMKYLLYGEMVASFSAPEDSVLYAHLNDSLVRPVKQTQNFYQSLCYSKPLRSCKNGKVIKLWSSCEWEGQLGKRYIAISADRRSYPLAIAGIALKEQVSGPYLSPEEETERYLELQTVSSCVTRNPLCTLQNSDQNATSFIKENGLFTRGFQEAFLKGTPFWMNLDSELTSLLQGTFAPQDIFAQLGTKSQFPELFRGRELPYDEEDLLIVYSSAKASNIAFLSAKRKIGGGSKYHLISGLCKNYHVVKLEDSAGLNITSDLWSTGFTDLTKMVLKEIAFTQETVQCMDIDNAWSKQKVCLNSNTLTVLEVRLELGHRGFIELDGELAAELNTLEKAPLVGFSSRHKGIFYGNIKSTYNIQVLDHNIRLSVMTRNLKAYVQLGDPLLPGNHEIDGIFFKVNSTVTETTFSSSTLTFQETHGFNFRYIYKAENGVVTGAKNNVKIVLILRLLQRSMNTSLIRVKAVLDKKFYADYELILSRSRVLTRSIKILTAIARHREKYREIYEGIKDLKSLNYELKCAVRSLVNRVKGISSMSTVEKALKFPLFYLKKIDGLEVEPERSQVKTLLKGISINWKGKFCLYRLCFDGLKISLIEKLTENIPCFKCKSNATLPSPIKKCTILKGIALKLTRLGGRVSLQKGATVNVVFDNAHGNISGNFTAAVSLFGRSHVAEFRISDGQLHFLIAETNIYKDLTVNVSGSRLLSTATWSSILESIYGTINRESRYSTSLVDHMQTYLRKTANYTKLRIQNVFAQAIEGNMELNRERSRLLSEQRKWVNMSEVFRRSKLMYYRQKVLLNRSQIIMQSYMSEISPIFIEKSLDRFCLLAECNRTCISMPVFQLCQKLVKVPIELQECKQVTQNIRNQVTEPFQTTCELRKYSFIPVYTGSCPENPGMAAQRRASLQQTMTSTGSAVGALVGSVFPGIGTLAGAVIGGIVGFVAGLFGGCDSTYEVYTKTWTVQEPCTRLRDTVKVTKRVYSMCYPTSKEVPTGYSEPKRCNETVNPCAVRMQDPVCITKNYKCQQLRDQAMAANQSIPVDFKIAFANVKKAQLGVQLATEAMRQAEKDKEFARKVYEEAKADFVRARQSSKFANQSRDNVMSLIRGDVCIVRHYEKSPDIVDHIRVINLVVNSPLPLIDNIEVQVNVYVIETKAMDTFSFVTQFQDQEGSVSSAARRLVQHVLCRPGRIRRSNEAKDSAPLFRPWYVDQSTNTSEVQKACLTMRSATKYLEKLVSDLDTLIKNHSFLGLYLEKSKKALLQQPVDLATNDRTLLMQSKTVKSALSKIHVLETESMIDVILTHWKLSAEFYTGLNNFSACFNLKDCIFVAIQSLEDLPTMLRVERQNYYMILQELRDTLLSLLNNVSHTHVHFKIEKVKQLIALTKSITLYCAPKPIVTMKRGAQERVQLNETVVLQCFVFSFLPVKYLWSRNGKVIEDEEKESLIFAAKRESNGFYECTAISLAGNGSSNGTQLTVEFAPVLLEEPSDIVYWMPSPKVVTAYFVCNGTGEPAASVDWFYQSYNSSEAISLPEAQNLTMFIPRRLGYRSSGYYFCEMKNKVGKVRSRMARLDYLHHYVADQRLTFRFNFSCSNASQRPAIFKQLASNMRRNKFHEVNFTVHSMEGVSRVLFELYAQPSTWVNGSKADSLLKVAARSRQDLASSFAEMLNVILRNRSILHGENGLVIHVMNQTIKSEFVGNVCRPGYAIKRNGFLCGRCKVGSFSKEGKCQPCPVGSYQSFSGKLTCDACTQNKTTKYAGSTGVSFCFFPDLCETNRNRCHKYARCLSINATYECQCLSNYTGDGYTCKSIEHGVRKMKEAFPIVLVLIACATLMVLAIIISVVMVRLRARRQSWTYNKLTEPLLRPVNAPERYFKENAM